MKEKFITLWKNVSQHIESGVKYGAAAVKRGAIAAKKNGGAAIKRGAAAAKRGASTVASNVGAQVAQAKRRKKTRTRSSSTRNTAPVYTTSSRTYSVRTAGRRGRSSRTSIWVRAKVWFCNLSSRHVNFFSWFTKKRMAVVASALVVCIVTPIVVVSALAPEPETTPSAVVEQDADVSAKMSDNTQEEDTNAEAVAPQAASYQNINNTTGEGADVSVKAAEASEETAAQPEETQEPKETEEVKPAFQTMEKGLENEKVAKLQERLMDLSYMDPDEPTQLFGPATKTAVELFQRKHELDITGKVDEATWNLLFSDKAQTYSVSVGIEGTDIESLQIRLRELGYIDKVTSYFGEETAAAVKKFQERNGLAVDGTVGAETREMLYSEDAKANLIDYGTENDMVLKYQERLMQLGYITQATGYFGPETQQAVKRFQERNGIIATGNIGPLTTEALMSDDAQPNALVVGVSGSDVEKVQNRLVELNYMNGATGYYGSATENAVRNFQKRNGLTVDGKVGAQTNKVLFSDDAKKAASGSSSSSSGSSSSTDKDKGSSSSGSGSSDKGESTTKVPNETSVNALISVAKSKLGCRYVRGGKGPNTFDCSGFVYWCLNQIGVKQGYMTSGGWANTTKYPVVKSMNDLKKGDIVSFSGHVGIYLGGGKMIDASSSDGCIRITSDIRKSSYWKSHFIKGLRVL